MLEHKKRAAVRIPKEVATDPFDVSLSACKLWLPTVCTTLPRGAHVHGLPPPPPERGEAGREERCGGCEPGRARTTRTNEAGVRVERVGREDAWQAECGTWRRCGSRQTDVGGVEQGEGREAKGRRPCLAEPGGRISIETARMLQAC